MGKRRWRDWRVFERKKEAGGGSVDMVWIFFGFGLRFYFRWGAFLLVVVRLGVSGRSSHFSIFTRSSMRNGMSCQLQRTRKTAIKKKRTNQIRGLLICPSCPHNVRHPYLPNSTFKLFPSATSTTPSSSDIVHHETDKTTVNVKTPCRRVHHLTPPILLCLPTPASCTTSFQI